MPKNEEVSILIPKIILICTLPFILFIQDPGYCLENCKSYCAQEDRTDGLSGSVSSEGGEVGILGTSTVVKGEDKPPSLRLPGLDFSSEKGRKLIGY